VRRTRGGKRKRGQVRVGTADRTLTPNAGMAAVAGLCERLGVIGALDAAVGPVKQRDRGFGTGELLAGIAVAQLAGEDFLAGLDRQRADAAGQQITPVPGRARPRRWAWPAGPPARSGWRWRPGWLRSRSG